MRKLEVDVAILGAGTAGLNARRAADNAGANAVLIDPGPLGTTCARVGCMPSKLLIAAADAAHDARKAGIFGVDTAPVRVDGRRVLERVRRERDRFVGFVLEATSEHEAAGRLISGHGRFISPNTIQVEDEVEVRFKSAVVATGSSPWVPPPFRGLNPDLMLFNDDVFELDALPKSVLVVGTGVIGLELGQALHRLGVRVTIVGKGGRLGPLSDPQILDEARSAFGAELDLAADYSFRSIEAVPGGVRVRFDQRDERFQRVLMAAGRRPNLAGIGLENTAVDLDAKGTPTVDPITGQIGDSHIFMAGDVTDFRPLLHEASDEGQYAGSNAATWPTIRAHRRRTPLGIVFCSPQMAVVGTPWSGLRVGVHGAGAVDYGDQGRARVINQNQGRVRIYARRETGELVGAEMFGPRVEHTAHLLAWAVQQHMTVDQALAMPFYHPVIEEGIRTALRDLQSNLHFRGPLGRPCEEVGPGA